MNIHPYAKLPLSFYNREDVVQIAQEMLGKYLFTNINGIVTAGKIVETEAYNGRTDRACHAYNKRTTRNDVMFSAGGRAYVYLCYGIHHLFNVVTNSEGAADAVLVRALEPVIGVEEMHLRRGTAAFERLTKGPGVLSQAMGITVKELNGSSLIGDEVWLAERANESVGAIETDVRIGVDYAGEDALLPWRFYTRDSKFVSRKKRNPS